MTEGYETRSRRRARARRRRRRRRRSLRGALRGGRGRRPRRHEGPAPVVDEPARPGRHRRRDGRGRLPGAARRGHAPHRSRALPAERRLACSPTRRRRASAISSSSASTFDDGLGLEGGHSRRRVVHAGGAATGDRVARMLAERVLAHPRIQVAEGERMLSVWRGRRPLRRRRHRPASDRRARDAPRDRRRGGALGADDEPGRLRRRGHGGGVPGRRGARRPRVRAVPPDDARRLVAPALGGAARRGRAAARRARATASPTSSRRATSSRGRSPRAGPSLLDLRAIDRGRFPSLMGSLSEEGYDPAADADPGRAGGPLHGRRRRHRPRRAHASCRASTRPASAPRRASTARTGSPRTRCSSASSSAAARRSRRSPSRRSRAALPDAPAPPAVEPVTPEHPRIALWRDCGLIRDAAGLARLARRAAPPHPARRASPRSRARRAAARTSARTSRRRARRSSATSSSATGAEPVLETWQ